MNKYFTVEVFPTILPAASIVYTTDDVMFDWTSFQEPRGANKLISISVIMRGINGAAQSNKDITFTFAKTIKGSAPATMGDVNATSTAIPAVSNHIIGMAHIDGAGDFGSNAFDYFSIAQTGSGAAASLIPMCVLEGEIHSGTNLGYDTLYIGAHSGQGVHDFGTAVLTDATVDVSGLSAATLSGIDGTDPRTVFAVGDIIHATDNIILGEIASMDADNITFRHDGGTTLDPSGAYTVPADLAAWKVQNGAGAAGDLANNDELFNIHPMKIILSFER